MTVGFEILVVLSWMKISGTCVAARREEWHFISFVLFDHMYICCCVSQIL